MGRDARHGLVFTTEGRSTLCALGFNLAESEGLGGDDEDDTYLDAEWQDDPDPDDFDYFVDEMPCPMGYGMEADGLMLCRECGRQSNEGMYGTDYFDGMWYCKRCWDQWEQLLPGQVVCSPWPLEADLTVGEEQCGAARLLLRAPGHLRCGIGGGILTEMPVCVPGSSDTIYCVAFNRRNLERWHKRSGGRCPLTLQPLDLRDVEEVPNVLQAVSDWLNAQGHLS